VVPIDVSPRTNCRASVLPVGVASPRDRSREFIVATFQDLQATWFPASDRDLAYPVPKFESTLESSAGEHRLTIHSSVLLRDIVINIDRIDPSATISDNVVTILPGESFTFIIRSANPLTQEQLTSPPVFQGANRFGKSI
jgi:beta-mannosidase